MLLWFMRIRKLIVFMLAKYSAFKMNLESEARRKYDGYERVGGVNIPVTVTVISNPTPYGGTYWDQIEPDTTFDLEMTDSEYLDLTTSKKQLTVSTIADVIRRNKKLELLNTLDADSPVQISYGVDDISIF